MSEARVPASEQLAVYAIHAEPHAAQARWFPRAFADLLACAIAARQDPSLMAATAGMGHLDAHAGSATVWFDSTRRSIDTAALLNATAAHALDFDDVWEPVRGHPSAVLLPALIAMAEHVDADGAAVAEAYAVSLQVGHAVAAALDLQAHYVRGWHATATVGVLSATAGVSRLLDLDVPEATNALGIAASLASGTRQNFGSMTKPLHAGFAARGAITAGVMASEGLTADAAALDGPLGLFALMGGDADAGRIPEVLRTPVDVGLSEKHFACCYNTHRAITAALEVRQALAVEPGTPSTDLGPSIDQVRVTVEPTGTAPLRDSLPETGLEAKFSMEYCIAVTLSEGAPRLEHFTDGSVQRAQLRDLARLVEVEESAIPPAGVAGFDDGYAVVEVRSKEGAVHRVRADLPGGHGSQRPDETALTNKLADCLAWAAVAIDAASVLAVLDGLDVVPVRTTMRRLAAELANASATSWEEES